MLFFNQHIVPLIVIFKEVYFMETIELTRKELYDIVWSTTLSKLTQQYAYTNEGIKKLCKQFEILVMAIMTFGVFRNSFMIQMLSFKFMTDTASY